MKTAATGCSGSDTSTARYHTGTPQCGFGTSTFTRILTVRSHSGPSQHCTTVSPRLLPSHAVARAWQAFSYFSKCVCSLMPSPEFCAGLSLRYNVQTCPEATAMETPPHQKKKKSLCDFTYTVLIMLQCWENDCYSVVRPVMTGNSVSQWASAIKYATVSMNTDARKEKSWNSECDPVGWAPIFIARKAFLSHVTVYKNTQVTI